MIAEITKKLISDYHPQKVILYGSFAYGKPNSDSDLDLLIIKETDKSFVDRWVEVFQILSGLHHTIPVEPLVLTPTELKNRLMIGDQFVEEIVSRGQVLYAA